LTINTELEIGHRPWGRYEVLSVAGEATVTNGEETLILTVNQSTYIPKQTKHRLENTTDHELVIIEVQLGSYLGEDDIVRIEDMYDRIGQNN